jgi:hypothetical protein
MLKMDAVYRRGKRAGGPHRRQCIAEHGARLHERDPVLPKVADLLLGASSGNRLLVVSHTDEEESLRIISARRQLHRKEGAMSQGPEDDDLEPEYDFSGAVRGKYYQRYQQGTNVVLLDADVAQAFKDSESVNRALRLLLDLAKQEVPQS